jgi:selenocysteine lyase/cysteine desulfurase
MPVREICREAKLKGVTVVVDGAHMHGQIPAKISEFGCDYFVASPHKWMFAPAGCGFLYIREENLERLWPAVVSGSWDDYKLKAARFMNVGTNNRAIFEGLSAGIAFGESVGRDAIYTRIHQLGRMAFDRAAKVPYLELLTPDDDRMFAGMVTFKFRKDPARLWEVCKEKKVWVINSPRLRLSTHIHTRPSDIDLFFGLMEETMGKA